MESQEQRQDLLSRRLAQWETELRSAHAAIVQTAQTDPQKAGHSAEGVWVKVAQQVLPPAYRVLTRRYMTTEVDIVVLPPSAPSFYDDADVVDIPGDVASAVIHVKNTLNRSELRDALQRVHAANSAPPHYRSTRAQEREGLPSAIVALGSSWKGEFTSARSAFIEILSQELPPTHPGQIPGFIGTPDWDILNYCTDIPGMPGPYQPEYQKRDQRWNENHVVKLIARESSGAPIHAFTQWLYTACSASDPSLESMRVALTQMFQLTGEASWLPFENAAVYSEARLSEPPRF